MVGAIFVCLEAGCEVEDSSLRDLGGGVFEREYQSARALAAPSLCRINRI